MSDWTEVSRLDEIPLLGARVVESPHGDIAVFRTSGDEVFALRDSCPHRGGALSQGIVHGRRVTCPLHNFVIGLDDGEAKGHDEGCTQTFPAKVEEGVVYLSLA